MSCPILSGAWALYRFPSRLSSVLHVNAHKQAMDGVPGDLLICGSNPTTWSDPLDRPVPTCPSIHSLFLTTRPTMLRPQGPGSLSASCSRAYAGRGQLVVNEAGITLPCVVTWSQGVSSRKRLSEALMGRLLFLGTPDPAEQATVGHPARQAHLRECPVLRCRQTLHASASERGGEAARSTAEMSWCHATGDSDGSRPLPRAVEQPHLLQ